MFPAPFDYHDPVTIDETLALLAKYGPEARLLAGGQSLVAAMNLGVAKPGVVIDLNRVRELDGIAEDDRGLVIGAMTRQADLARSELVRRACPLLAEAVELVGNARVRARGTLGGSLAHADPYAELPAVICSLDAILTVGSSRGSRPIPAQEFFVGPLTTALEPVEVLTEVHIPRLPPRSGWAIEEVARRPGDFAIAGAVASVVLAEDRSCADARLACFGAGPSLMRATSIEETLVGSPLDDGRINAVVEMLDAESSAYETQILRVVVGRALARARDRAIAANGAGR